MTEKSGNVPLNGFLVSLTAVTSASDGPFQHQASISATAASSPSNNASTSPFAVFLTQPVSPSSSAFSFVLARNHTPCTRPEMITCACVFIQISFPYGLNRNKVRGNGIASLMFSALQIQAVSRSTPKPYPACGTEPYRRRSKYHW